MNKIFTAYQKNILKNHQDLIYGNTYKVKILFFSIGQSKNLSQIFQPEFRSILHLEVDPIRVDRLDEDQIRVDRLEDEEETIQQDIPLPLHMARYKIRVDHLEDVEESLLQDIPLPLHMTR
jgi:hypothetical protein